MHGPRVFAQGDELSNKMAELLLEIFSEEIPARMQRKAAEDLQKLVTDALVERGTRRLGRGLAGGPVLVDASGDAGDRVAQLEVERGDGVCDERDAVPILEVR